MKTQLNQIDQQRLLSIALRNDLVSFVTKCFETISGGQNLIPNWHIETICAYLLACENSEIKRMIFNLPPRSLKSICVSVIFPAWILGHKPNAKIICISYSNALSEKHAADCKRIMESPWYKKLFPATRISKTKNTQQEFFTTASGFRLATSIEGVLTGRGGDYIIVDDPLKPNEALSEARRNGVNEWMSNTAFSRLDDKKKGVIIICMQRVHQNDLTGHLKELGNWKILSIPAISEYDQSYYLSYPFHSSGLKIYKKDELMHEARESMEEIIELQNNLNTYNFSAQYQQNPIPISGNLIKWDWFKFYEKLPDENPTRIIQSWDTASKIGENNDYSVCTTWYKYKNAYYLCNILRRKLEFPELKKVIIAHANDYNPHAILIEDKGSGIQLIQDLSRETCLSVIGVNPEADKQTRMLAQSPKIEAGKVFIPKEAAWLADFQKEALSFPNSKHDDQIDSLSQALQYMTEYRELIFAFL